MEVLGVICARKGSQGVKNKHLLAVFGKPVIAYSIEAALEAKLINRLILTSDSLKILKIAKSYGIETIKRPASYARDDSPIEEPLRHVVEHLKNKEGYFPDLVVLIYGNVIFRKENLIDQAIQKLIKTSSDAIVSVSKTERYHPERLCLVKNDKFFLYKRRISSYLRQNLPSVYFIDSGVIVFKTKLLFGKDSLIISNYFKRHKVCAIASEDIGAWDIDSLFDLEIAKILIRKKGGTI